MKNKLFIIVICVCFLLAGTGCSKRKSVPVPPPDQADILEPLSQRLVARVFVDATVSMEGFVVPGPSTNYTQMIPCLESAVVSGWKDEDMEFYKFGTRVSPIDRQEYLSARYRSFYHDPQVKLETRIQRVVDYTADPENPSNGLNIIVTDLFQSESDVTVLVSRLKKEYIQKNLAVGIAGISSQYCGTVYDVDGAYFPYVGMRPFYVLMLGKCADIAHYLEQLKSSGLPFISEGNFIIFSRHLVNPLSSFEGASVDLISNLVETSRLLASDIRDKRIKQFRIRGNPESADFTATLRYNPLPCTMSFDPNGLEAEVIAKQLQGEVFVESAEAGRSFVIEELRVLGGLSDRKLSFTVNLKPTSLPGNGIYLYEVILRPRASAYRMASWCTEWDMGATQDGSKTLNLNRFLNDLWKATVQVHQPKVARFYCYIKKG